MTIGSKEHYEIMKQFERDFKYLPLTKEQDKDLWKIGAVYKNGQTKDLFKAFRIGYYFGIKTMEMELNG